jgi:maltose/maltodextrin transport system substrate-binding protein
MAFFLFVSLPFWGKSQTKQCESGETGWEYKFPLRPGIPGKVPFWNAYAKSFMYAPAFDFKFIEKATFYRFTAFSLAANKEFTFDAKVPYAPLTPIWDKLPIGQVALTVEGLDDKEQIFGLSGTRVFYRAAGYNDPRIRKKMDYYESAVKALAKHTMQPGRKFTLKRQRN